MSTYHLAPRIAATLLTALVVSGIASSGDGAAARQGATPSADLCAGDTPGAGSGGMVTGTPMAGMAMGTPSARTEGMVAEFDQLYIDGMIPHHASIIPVAQAALPRLGDQRLVGIAENIVASQSAEIEELRGYRERFYGSREPMPMDEQSMATLEQVMPGMGAMMAQMDPAADVATLCAAEDPDLAFIDLTIPHHRSAVAMSEAALDQSTHDEIRTFAERVIAAQQREIDELSAVRAELYGSATPAAGGHERAVADGHDDDRHGDEPPADRTAIRALAPDVVAQIERGEGAGFALPAERNGVPGPSHVLALADELGLTADQRERVDAIFAEMRAAAIPAGQRYLDGERALETDLRAGELAEGRLGEHVARVSRLEGDLATVHLTAHLRTAGVLTPDQIAAYSRLRASA